MEDTYMSRSRVVIKLMDEAVDGAKPITDFEGLKINQDVVFADGHEFDYRDWETCRIS